MAMPTFHERGGVLVDVLPSTLGVPRPEIERWADVRRRETYGEGA